MLETGAKDGDYLTSQNLIIRPAQATDSNALATCIDAAYAQYSERISDMPAVSDGCAEDIVTNQVWVAVNGDEVVAGLVLIARDGFMKLANLAVHPDHAGKGLGRELITLAERETKRQGYVEMRLNTHVDMPENVRLYQRLGWAEVSRSGSTVSMAKHLPSD
ncbi:MAG: GNAT family N-acetyltransferase [Paracoccaceae bacterium]